MGYISKGCGGRFARKVRSERNCTLCGGIPQRGGARSQGKGGVEVQSKRWVRIARGEWGRNAKGQPKLSKCDQILHSFISREIKG